MESNKWDHYWTKSQKDEYWTIPANEVIEFLDIIENQTEKTVLDLGCGLGRHAIACAKRDFDVFALDFSEEAIEQLNRISKKNGLNIKTKLGNYKEKYFQDESFDVIIAFNVLYHGGREAFQSAVDMCREYIKPNGLILMTCPTLDDGKYGSGEEVEPHAYKSMNSVHPGEIHYFCDENEIDNIMKGFKILSKTKKEYYWMNGNKKQFCSYWVIIGQKVDNSTA